MLKVVLSFVILFSSISSVFAQSNATLPAKLPGTTVLKTPPGLLGQSNGLKCATITTNVDTSIRVAPIYAYLAIDFSQITGSNQMDILNGSHLYWVFDKTGKEIKIPAKVLTSVKAAMESNGNVELKVRVPFKLKTDKNIYTIHYRWESKDKSRNMDFLTTK